MNFPMISKVLGLLMMIFSIALLPPILVSYLYNENTHQVFLLSFFFILTLGLVMWLPFNGKKTELRARDGLLITVMFWLELGIVGAFPFYLSDSVNLSTTDAIFESISGLTTTGATVISGLVQRSSFSGNTNVTAKQIKLFFPLMLLGGIIGMIMMWVTDFPAP